MNRPRNRQPRPQRQQNQQRPARNLPRPQQQQRPNNGPVPTVQQVVPGAGVSIVLKEDQPTGRETTGMVQDVLTKGNHPRGIKVRLCDGQVGRVQRMRDAASGGESKSTSSTATATTTSTARFTQRYTDVRNDEEFPAEPPPRSLADFFPSEPAPPTDVGGNTSGHEMARCPFCESFEGDELAVSYHVDQEHLT